MKFFVLFLSGLLICLSIHLSQAKVTVLTFDMLKIKQNVCCCDINGCLCCTSDESKCQIKVSDAKASSEPCQMKDRSCFNAFSSFEYVLLFYPYLTVFIQDKVALNGFYNSFTTLFFSPFLASIALQDRPPEFKFC